MQILPQNGVFFMYFFRFTIDFRQKNCFHSYCWVQISQERAIACMNGTSG